LPLSYWQAFVEEIISRAVRTLHYISEEVAGFYFARARELRAAHIASAGGLAPGPTR
jgi:hypothetical protein